MSSQEFEPLDALTEREQEVLAALVDGLSNQQIAAHLHLSLNTVKWYNRQIYSKLDVANRQEAIAHAEKLHLLDPDAPVDTIPHNLAESALPFIGRKDDIQTLKHLLSDYNNRLVTIMGAGGMGKTTLSLEVGRQLLGYFTDGVYLVKLAPLSQATEIPNAVVEALGIHQTAANYDFSLNNITQLLRDKSCLLILDNYEHLLPDGINVITHILQHTSQVTILATSRERLNMGSETVFTIGGMVHDNDAVSLFCQHVRRIQHEFEPTEDDLDHIMHICQLTGGMPLALILAAAWIEVFSLEEIAEEIQHNLDFLSTTLRDIPERQQSIEAIFEATWGRLSEAEQTAFLRFSVFVGGCSRDAARAVTGANPRTLMNLINKSLISHNAETERYEIHELLRQYAEAKLNEHDLVEETQNRHAEHYLTYMANQLENLKRGQVDLFKEQVIADWDNIFKATLAAWGWQAEHEAVMRNATLAIYIFYEDVRPIPVSTDQIQQINNRRIQLNVSDFHPAWLTLSTVLGMTDDMDGIEVLNAIEGHVDEEFLAFSYLRTGFWMLSKEMDVELVDAYNEKALAIYQSLEDDYWIGQTYLFMSFSFTYVPDPIKSYKEFALEHFQRINNPIKIAQSYIEIALDYAYEHRDLELGRHYAEIALEKAFESGIMLQIMQARTYLSTILFSFGEAEAIRQNALASIENNASYVHDIVRVYPYVHLSYITSYVDEDYETALALSKKAESLQTHWSGGGHRVSTALALLGLDRRSEMLEQLQRWYDPLKAEARDGIPLFLILMILWREERYEQVAELLGFILAKYPRATSDVGWQWSLFVQARTETKAALNEDTYAAALARYADTEHSEMMPYVAEIMASLM